MKSKNKRKTEINLLSALLAACLLFSAGSTCRAQESIATTDFFHDGISARAYAMGGAFVAVADDVSAIYWNPAGLYQVDAAQLFTTRSTRSELDITTQTLSAATPYGRSMVGFTLVYSSMGNLILTSRNDTTGYLEASGVAGEDDISFAGTYSWPYRENLSFGASLKYARQKVISYSASGWGLDLGTMYHYNEQTRFGLSLQNIGDMDIGTDAVPMNVRLGASTRALDDNLLVSASYDSDFLDEQVYGLGAEYIMAENFAARIGSMDGEFTAGLGIAYENLSLDYAFHSDDETGDIQKLTIGYRIPTRKKKPFVRTKAPERRPKPQPAPVIDLKEKEEKKKAEPEEEKKEKKKKKSSSSKKKSSSSKAKKSKEKEEKKESLDKLDKSSSIPSAESSPAPQPAKAVYPAAAPSGLPEEGSELPSLPDILPGYEAIEADDTIDLSFPVPREDEPVVPDTIHYPYYPAEGDQPAMDYWPVEQPGAGENIYGLDPE